MLTRIRHLLYPRSSKDSGEYNNVAVRKIKYINNNIVKLNFKISSLKNIKSS